jgi:RNA polymerase subunit RPABC4/transcription elongation factor Spt4
MLRLMVIRMFGMRVVECLQCHRITLPGDRECPHCKASLAKNSVVHRIRLQNPDEMVHASVSCPRCSRLLKTDTETCPECGTFIWREYADRSIKANVTVGQAYVQAQHIESLKAGAWLMLALAAGLHVAAGTLGPVSFRTFLLLPLACSMLSLLTVRRWFRRFGGYESDHEDFAAARDKVKGTLRLLLGVVAAQLIGVALLWLLW